MKIRFLITTIFLINAFTSAYAISITCPIDGIQLSKMFEYNWEYNSSQDKYFSIVNFPIESNILTGTLHTLINELPHDKNPHLMFATINVSDIPHYSIWNIDCKYNIENKLMADSDDGLLHMTTSVSDYDYNCQQVSNNTVICERK